MSKHRAIHRMLTAAALVLAAFPDDTFGQGAVTAHVVVAPVAATGGATSARSGFTVCFGTTTNRSQYGSGTTSSGGVVNQNLSGFPSGNQLLITVTKSGFTGSDKLIVTSTGSNHVDFAPVAGSGGPACGSAGGTTTPPAAQPPANPGATTPPAAPPKPPAPPTVKPPAPTPPATKPPAPPSPLPPAVSVDGIALIPISPDPTPAPPTLTPAVPGMVRIVITVYRQSDRMPLQGASVCVGSNQQNTTLYGRTGLTNINGQIAFNVPPVGNWHVTAKKSGFTGVNSQYFLGTNDTRGIVQFSLFSGSGGPSCPALAINPNLIRR